MVKNQKKPLVAASRDELLCVALPVIHRLFGVFILQKENQVLGEKLLGDEDDVQLQPYHYKPWFLCMGDLSEDENNEANRSLAIWYDKDSVTLISED